MKFLCLHGAFGSANNFQAQLGPFVQETESACGIKFKWISGLHDAEPPANFDDYFGKKPLYRFIPFDGISALDDVLFKLDQFPQGESAEDTMRQLLQTNYSSPYTKEGVRTAIDYILDALREDPDIQGILGFSEGAVLAASVILEERRRYEEEGTPRQIQSAVFFAGWPPLSLKNGDVSILLADECDAVIDIPTCHVVGCNDPYIDGAMALYSMCDEDTADLFDHGTGHFVPRDATTLSELSASVSNMLEKVKARSDIQDDSVSSEADDSLISDSQNADSSNTSILTSDDEDVKFERAFDANSERVFEDVKVKNVFEQLKPESIFEDMKAEIILGDMIYDGFVEDGNSETIDPEVSMYKAGEDAKPASIPGAVKQESILEHVIPESILEDTKHHSLLDDIRADSLFQDIQPENVDVEVNSEKIGANVKVEEIGEHIKPERIGAQVILDKIGNEAILEMNIL